MLLPDVSVLVSAHREECEEHDKVKYWLEQQLGSPAAYAVSDAILADFIRVVTSPRIFRTPSTLEEAFAFAEAVRGRRNAISVTPGRRHWRIFTSMSAEGDARGNLAAIAWVAALAVESKLTLVTLDRSVERFPGLRWQSPFD
jgi:toxin-antitoxin system PIN domain toxin